MSPQRKQVTVSLEVQIPGKQKLNAVASSTRDLRKDLCQSKTGRTKYSKRWKMKDWVAYICTLAGT